MAIGDFLAGAGRVGAGMRQAQSEIRAARLEQLRMEEANRVQRMYEQLDQQMRQGGLKYKGVTPGETMDLEVVEAKKPSTPTKKPAVPKPAAPSTAPAPTAPTPAATANVRAALSAIQQGKEPTTPPAPISGGEGTTALGGGAGSDRLEPAGVPTRPTGPGYDPYGRANQQFPNFSLTQLLGGNPPAATPAAASVTGTQPTEAEIAEMDARRLAEARAQAGVTPPEAGPAPAAAAATAQPTGDVSPATPRTPQEVVATEADVAQLEIPQQTLTRANFYLGDPTMITRDMQRAMDKREELVRYANIMLASRTAQGLQAFLQMKSQIDTIDDGMIELQGMQGIQELNDYNDPRRLAGVLSEVTGGRLAIQPRTDGTYNIVAAPGTPNQTVIHEGVSTDELAVHAMRRFSPAYRAQEIADNREIEMLRTKTQLEANLEGVKAGYKRQDTVTGKMYDMNIKQAEIMGKIYAEYVKNQGKISAAMVTAGGKLGLKPATGATDAQGNPILLFTTNDGKVLRYEPTRTEETGGGMFSDPTVNIFPEQLVPVPGLTLPQGQ